MSNRTANSENRTPHPRRTVAAEAMLAQPQPLISSEHKLVVLWTPKVGCTFLIKWFFKSPAGGFGRRDMPVHKFRQFKYYPSEEYKSALRDYLQEPSEYRHIKLVRNPYQRAVSSYIQFLKMSENNPRAFKQFLGITDIPSDFAYSFADFIETLAGKNIATCNQHWRQQLHPVEEYRFLDFRYAELENSIDFLKTSEEELELPRTPKNYLHNLRNQKHHTERKQVADGFYGDTKFDAVSANSAPSFRHFYNEDLTDAVRSIYRRDFRFYNFSEALED